MARETKDEQKELVEPGKPIPSATSIDVQADREVKEWGKWLAKQPKRRVRLPLPEPDMRPEDDKMGQIVGFNGYNYRIQRGVEVEVPEPIWEILHHARLA